MQEDNNVPQEITETVIDNMISDSGEAPESNEVTTESAEPVDSENPKQQDLDSNYRNAMQEERERRKELQRQNQDMQNRLQQMEGRFQMVLERLNPQLTQQQQVQEPSFDEDPIGAIKYEQERMKQYLQAIDATEKQKAYIAQEQQVFNNFLNKYHEDAMSFAKGNNDFKDAYSHLIQSRMDEYKAAGYSQKEAASLINEDEMAIALKAYQDGVNPAQRVYELARIRGYQKRSSEGQKQMQQFENLKNGSMSLNNTGSSVNSNSKITLETLAHMNDKDFEKHWESVLSQYK